MDTKTDIICPNCQAINKIKTEIIDGKELKLCAACGYPGEIKIIKKD